MLPGGIQTCQDRAPATVRRADIWVFLIFLKFIIKIKREQAKGNSFAQLLHDGGTLKNHKKYQVFSMQE